MHYATVQTH